MDPGTLYLACLAVVYFFTKNKTDQAAYAAGKEPPGVAKARMRHESSGGRRSARSGRPKGPGAFRRMLAERWGHASDRARQRGDHNAARRHAWFDETAPQREQRWRDKQQRKLGRRDWAREQWARKRGLIDPAEVSRRNADRKAEEEAYAENDRRDRADRIQQAADAAWKRRGTGHLEEEAYAENERRDAEAARVTSAAKRAANADTRSKSARETLNAGDPAGRKAVTGWGSRPGSKPAGGCSYTVGDPADPDASMPCGNPVEPGESYCNYHTQELKAGRRPDRPPPRTTNNSQSNGTSSPKGTATVYQQAVDQLNRQADQVAEFKQNLAAFGDTLAGKKWGTEVTGPIGDMNTRLAKSEGNYRDLAGQMKQQGDRGSEARDQAPYVPEIQQLV